MSTSVFKNALFMVNGTDMSQHVGSVSLSRSAESLDETAMGDNTRIHKGGLLDWSIEVTPHQDFAAGQWDATFFSLVGTTACYEIRPFNTCTTAINPSYQGIGIVTSYQPAGGDVGSLLDAPVSIVSANDLVRSTTAT